MASALLYVGSCTGDLPYVRRPAGKGIAAFRLDLETGASRPLGVVEDIANPTFVAVAPDGVSLCAISEIAGEVEGQVSAYAIDRVSGALHLLSRLPTAGFTPAHLGFSPDGRHVAVVNYGDVPATSPAGASLAIFPRAPDGSLGPVLATATHAGHGPNAARQDRPHAHCVRFTPDGQFVFVADLGIDRLVVYRFDGTTLARQAEAVLPPGAGPRHFAFPPNGPGLYVINELGNSVATLGSRFELRADVALLPAGQTGTAHASAIALSPDGHHIFAGVRGTDVIVRLDLDADGVARVTGATPSAAARRAISPSIRAAASSPSPTRTATRWRCSPTMTARLRPWAKLPPALPWPSPSTRS